MHAAAAMNFCLMCLLGLLAFGCAFFFWPEIPVILLFLMIQCAIYHIFNSTGDEGGDFSGAVTFMFFLVSWIILVYAVMYLKSGLVINGEFTEVSFFESLYFSITTWTTLGYGDISPSPRMRLITSSQALMGYVSMGVWIAVLGAWIVQRSERRKAIHDHNRSLVSISKLATESTKKEGEQADGGNQIHR